MLPGLCPTHQIMRCCWRDTGGFLRGALGEHAQLHWALWAPRGFSRAAQWEVAVCWETQSSWKTAVDSVSFTSTDWKHFKNVSIINTYRLLLSFPNHYTMRIITQHLQSIRYYKQSRGNLKYSKEDVCRSYSNAFYEGFEHLWILVSAGGPGTNLPRILRDGCIWQIWFDGACLILSQSLRWECRAPSPSPPPTARLHLGVGPAHCDASFGISNVGSPLSLIWSKYST